LGESFEDLLGGFTWITAVGACLPAKPPREAKSALAFPADTSSKDVGWIAVSNSSLALSSPSSSDKSKLMGGGNSGDNESDNGDGKVVGKWVEENVEC